MSLRIAIRQRKRRRTGTNSCRTEAKSDAGDRRDVGTRLRGVSSEIAIRCADGRRRRNGLGALQQTDLGADLGIRSLAISIELADVDADDGRAGAVDSLIERPDLPRAGSRRQPCWKANGVGGQHVGLAGELARGLMLAFTIGAVARKQRDDDVRSERAHDRYDVSENRIARPIGPDDWSRSSRVQNRRRE